MWKLGDLVYLRDIGPGRITDVPRPAIPPPESYCVKTAYDVHGVAAATADELLRRLGSVADARVALAVLHDDVQPRPPTVPALPRRAAELRERYAATELDAPARTAILRLEREVVREIAWLLDRDPSRLVAELRERYPAFERLAPELCVVGRRVFVRRSGPGVVLEVGDAEVTLQMSETLAYVRREDAERILRPVIDHATAERYLALLCAPAPKLRTLAPLTSSRMFDACPLDQQLEYIRLYFRALRTLSGIEQGVIKLQESLFVDELANVLGRRATELRAAIRKGRVSFASATRPALAKTPTLRGHELLGDFDAGSSITIGDPIYCKLESAKPTADGVAERFQLACVPGRWAAFQKTSPDDDVTALVAVHVAHAGAIVALRKQAIEIGAIWVDGGRAAIVDTDALGDDVFVAEHLEDESSDPLLDHHGCVVSTGGDGTFPVRVARDGDRAVLIWIDLD